MDLLFSKLIFKDFIDSNFLQYVGMEFASHVNNYQKIVWFLYDIIKNMIKQIIVNFPHNLGRPVRP